MTNWDDKYGLGVCGPLSSGVALQVQQVPWPLVTLMPWDELPREGRDGVVLRDRAKLLHGGLLLRTLTPGGLTDTSIQLPEGLHSGTEQKTP